MFKKLNIIKLGGLLALFNFGITVVLGTLLRYNVLFPIDWLNVRFWIHAHSHVGFLGWVFTALVTMGYTMLLPDQKRLNHSIFWLLIATQLAVLGMLFTFPFMGYAMPSIVFSTLHLVFSIVFAVLFFRHAPKSGFGIRFFKTGLIFMIISSLGPLALGPLTVMGYKNTTLYDFAIYFYLHFQYNGWFTLAVFGLMVRWSRDRQLVIRKKKGLLFYRLIVFSAILTLALSALGFMRNYIVWGIAGIGTILQLWAGSILLNIILGKHKLLFRKAESWVTVFIIFSLVCWFLKIILQFLSAIPIVSDFAYLNREVIMFYLHLVFLGFTSCFLIAIFIKMQLLSAKSNLMNVGFGVYLISVVLMLLCIAFKSMPQMLTFQMFKALDILLFVTGFGVLISVIILIYAAITIHIKTENHSYDG